MENKPSWPHGNVVTLRPHMGAGQWFKKVRGKCIYFGVLRDPDGALKKYLEWARAVASHDPAVVPNPPEPESITLHVGLNHFLNARQTDVNNGDLTPNQFMRYKRACALILRVVGDRQRKIQDLRPDDFAAIREKITGSPVTIGNVIRDARVAFQWTIDHYGVSVRYGTSFKRPTARSVRATSKKRETWPAADLRKVLKHAQPNIRAMILLGINCGFGQMDCATLPLDKITPKGHTFDRPKTGVKRCCPFWRETYKAIQDRHRWRPDLRPDLVFLSKYGRPLVRDEVVRAEGVNGQLGKIIKSRHKDAVREMFRRACVDAGVKYRSFYSLRHTFCSVANTIPDQTAVKVIMGHKLPGLDDTYVHLMADGMKRLKVVTDHVHRWLFGG